MLLRISLDKGLLVPLRVRVRVGVTLPCARNVDGYKGVSVRHDRKCSRRQRLRGCTELEFVGAICQQHPLALCGCLSMNAKMSSKRLGTYSIVLGYVLGTVRRADRGRRGTSGGDVCSDVVVETKMPRDRLKEKTRGHTLSHI